MVWDDKLWSGEDVTDDEEASSWTMSPSPSPSLASLLGAASLQLLSSKHKQKKQQAPPTSAGQKLGALVLIPVDLYDGNGMAEEGTN